MVITIAKHITKTVPSAQWRYIYSKNKGNRREEVKEVWQK